MSTSDQTCPAAGLTCAACSGTLTFSSRTAQLSPAQLSDEVAAAAATCASAASEASLLAS
jgi:hypothetical protein